MSVLNNSLLLGADAAGGYAISRSLRFNSADSAYLSRTPASAGNRKTWTWAGWAKRGSVGSSYEILFSARAGTSSNRDYLTFQSDQLVLTCSNSSGTTTANIQTTSVYRDPGAGMHIVLSVDTTQATASNRVKFYVNGAQITTFSLANYPTQNTDLSFNDAQPHTIGQSAAGTAFGFNGYLADIHFIDGQALDPTSFGEFSATTGVWMPKAYSGTYGTNGFRLTFADNSAATATTLGKDAAGSNNWTPNNLSVTAGAGNDSLVDVPVNGSEVDTGSGGQVRGNYATLNPLALTAHTLANGNLDVSSSAIGIAVGTIGMSTGKWYWEITLNTVSANVSPTFGYVNQAFNTATAGTTYPGSGANDGCVRRDNGQAFQNNTSTSYTGAAGFSAGDVAMVAFDADAKKMWVGKNGTWYNSGAPASGTGNIPLTITGTTFFPAFNTYGDSWSVNFGARSFAYTAPSGFKALCTANLPAPVVTKPSTVFDVATWTGDGASSRTITLPGSPSVDLVWLKSRSNAFYHGIYDVVRGTNKVIFPNDTLAEINTPANGYVSAFNSNGFTLTAGSSSSDDTNKLNSTYVAWCWDAGSSTVTNTQGSITTSLRTNSYLSVITYSGTGSSATIGHGLGVAPQFFLIKRRNTASSWIAWHTSIGNSDILRLESTNATQTISGFWQNTRPTSSLIYLDTDGTVNANGSTYVCYAFAPVAGYSAFGSYTGNGSADGPFVYTGFRPRWVMVKRTDTSTFRWVVWDSARDTYNLTTTSLYPNLSDSELTGFDIDIVSNGFKLRDSENTLNQSNGAYIYAAFAESPFQYARAR
jgi:hypothetical protein